MPKPPVLKPREVCAIPETMGFRMVKQRGSHMQYRHADGRGTTVANHPGQDISPIILRKISHDIGVTIEELLRHR